MKPSNIIASPVMIISITSLPDLQQNILNDGPVFEPAETTIDICYCVPICERLSLPVVPCVRRSV